MLGLKVCLDQGRAQCILIMIVADSGGCPGTANDVAMDTMHGCSDWSMGSGEGAEKSP